MVRLRRHSRCTSCPLSLGLRRTRPAFPAASSPTHGPPSAPSSAYLHVTDIAGLVKGASEGAGLGNNFLSHIQAVDGIFHVVRAFDNDEILHVDDSVDPVRDLETITHELCAKDLEYVLKMVAEELKDVKKSPGMKISALFTATMERVKELLKADTPVRNAQWNNPEVEMIRNKARKGGRWRWWGGVRGGERADVCCACRLACDWGVGWP